LYLALIVFEDLEKPSFREALRRRVIPISSFYYWQEAGRGIYARRNRVEDRDGP
jgi:putative SOS response-associated peptidase YedK